MRLFNIGIIAGISILLSSCSIFLPYEENYSCKKGDNTGLCGSVSDVYEFYNKGYTIEEIKKKRDRK